MGTGRLSFLAEQGLEMDRLISPFRPFDPYVFPGQGFARTDAADRNTHA